MDSMDRLLKSAAVLTGEGLPEEEILERLLWAEARRSGRAARLRRICGMAAALVVCIGAGVLMGRTAVQPEVYIEIPKTDGPAEISIPMPPEEKEDIPQQGLEIAIPKTSNLNEIHVGEFNFPGMRDLSGMNELIDSLPPQGSLAVEEDGMTAEYTQPQMEGSIRLELLKAGEENAAKGRGECTLLLDGEDLYATSWIVGLSEDIKLSLYGTGDFSPAETLAFMEYVLIKA